MKKNTEIIIKNVNVELVDGVMDESIFTNLELQTGKDTIYYTLFEYGGMACEFYKSKENLYDYFMNEEELTDEQIDFVKSKLIYSLGDVNLKDSNNWYDDIFESLESAKDEESKRIIKLLISFTRLNWKDIKDLKEKVIGKNLFEFDITVSDVEEEYIEMNIDYEDEVIRREC